MATAPASQTAAPFFLAGATRAELTTALAEIGVPERELRMRVGQLWHWIYHRGVRDFSAMRNVARPVIDALGERFSLARPEIVAEQVSADGTRKWLVRIPDWDLSWQGVYRLKEPLALPRGTAVAALAKDYAELIKARVTTLIVMTAWCGFYFGAAQSGVSSLSWTLLHALLGIGLVSGGTAAMNEVMEREGDALMRRTARRPLVPGSMSVAHGTTVSLALRLLRMAEFAEPTLDQTLFWSLSAMAGMRTLGCAICDFIESKLLLLPTQRPGSTQKTLRSTASGPDGTIRSAPMTRSCFPPVTISPASRSNGRPDLL